MYQLGTLFEFSNCTFSDCQIHHDVARSCPPAVSANATTANTVIAQTCISIKSETIVFFISCLRRLLHLPLCCNEFAFVSFVQHRYRHGFPFMGISTLRILGNCRNFEQWNHFGTSLEINNCHRSHCEIQI